MTKKQKKLVIKSLENVLAVSKVVTESLYNDVMNNTKDDKGKSFEAFTQLSSDTIIVGKYLRQLKRGAR